MHQSPKRARTSERKHPTNEAQFPLATGESRSMEEVTNTGAAAGQVGGSMSGDVEGRVMEIDGGSASDTAATNNGGGLRREARLRGHDGIIEDPAAVVNVAQAGVAGDLPAHNADHFQRLLQQRRLAAEQELKVIGRGLMTSTSILMLSIIRTIAQPPAWVSKAMESGEQHYRARFYSLCNTLAFAHAASVLGFLCLYHLKVFPAERALPAARTAAVLTYVCMSSSVGGSEDWLGAVVTFLFIVAIAAVTFLLCIGKLKEYVQKIGKLLGF